MMLHNWLLFKENNWFFGLNCVCALNLLLKCDLIQLTNKSKTCWIKTLFKIFVVVVVVAVSVSFIFHFLRYVCVFIKYKKSNV